MNKAVDTAFRSYDLNAFWMPFTANRQFKSNPRLLVAAKDMHYTSHDGRQILDGTAGLWCVNAGHGRAPIVEAVQRQVARMDYAPSFQMGHPVAFEAAANKKSSSSTSLSTKAAKRSSARSIGSSEVKT